MSILGCTECAVQVDTDYDIETLYVADVSLGTILCPECAESNGYYHPKNDGEIDEQGNAHD